VSACTDCESSARPRKTRDFQLLARSRLETHTFVSWIERLENIALTVTFIEKRSQARKAGRKGRFHMLERLCMVVGFAKTEK